MPFAVFEEHKDMATGTHVDVECTCISSYLITRNGI